MPLPPQRRRRASASAGSRAQVDARARCAVARVDEAVRRSSASATPAVGAAAKPSRSSSWRRRSAPARRAALPETKVWRDADVLPASAVQVGVAHHLLERTPAAGRPRRRTICGRIVAVPWPISMRAVVEEEWRRVALQRSAPRIVDGLAITVLPMPYHMQAMPAPRRSGDPLAAARVVDAARRRAPPPRRPQRVEAGAQADAAPRASGPVGVASPATSALRWRNSRRVDARARRRARRSAARPSSVDCGTPKPRNAPATLSLVSTARVSARTFGDAVRAAWRGSARGWRPSAPTTRRRRC